VIVSPRYARRTVCTWHRPGRWQRRREQEQQQERDLVDTWATGGLG
jgi:hypothetical protein